MSAVPVPVPTVVGLLHSDELVDGSVGVGVVCCTVNSIRTCRSVYGVRA